MRPLVRRGRVYVGSRQGENTEFVALDAEMGDVLWRNRRVRVHWAIWAKTANGPRIFVNNGRTARALDPENGSILWRTDMQAGRREEGLAYLDGYVSHITDEAFYDVMEVAEAPVVATHSSARHFTPGWERNMSDEMIQRLAENGGVITINFGSSFLRDEYQDDDDPARENVSQFVERKGLSRGDSAAIRYYQKQRRAHPIGTVGDVVDHIDHVVDLVGIEHVGLGSDYDGVFTLPANLQDVRAYPNLIEELLRRGYTEDEIAKILGGNLLRVWKGVEQVAK